MHMDHPVLQPHGVLGYSHTRRRSALGRVLVGVGVVCILIGGVGFLGTVLPQRLSDVPTVTVRVPATVDEAVAALTRAGALHRPTLFRLAVMIRSRPIQDGVYTVYAGSSVWSLARLLTTTLPRLERLVRITEGWTLRDIGRYLEEQGIARSADLYRITGAPAVDYRTANVEVPRPKDLHGEFSILSERPEFVSFEGYLFPDTYRVYVDASVEDIVRKMLANLEQQLTPDLRREITESGRTVHQILTMASIIEAEISRREDRPTAAGILWKRRDRGMHLQVDATVNYVTGKRDPRVSRDDSALDSAYNTYRYPGLPRGPIGSPGLDAILAALRPVSSPYWFFLTTRDGRTVFSRTLGEHQVNVNRHLRARRETGAPPTTPLVPESVRPVPATVNAGAP